MTVALIIGTRPEAIKLAPLATHLGAQALLIHTGQHHSPGMNTSATRDHAPTAGTFTGNGRHLTLPVEHDSRSSRGERLGRTTAALSRMLALRGPDAVIVQGDTTSALAGALAANTTGIPLVHIEAGLRSFDRAMPEEHHRVLIDHLADLNCAPTPLARDNMLAEQIPEQRIALTGNTIVEALLHALPTPAYQLATLIELGLAAEHPATDRPAAIDYVLATIHRPENTDDPARLTEIFTQLAAAPVPVILPLHPRTLHEIHDHQIPVPDTIRTLGPLDYSRLLSVLAHTTLLITDSGGMQEEATILRRPVIVVRRSNERPEVEDSFGTRIGVDSLADTMRHWLANARAHHARLATLGTPYGDGTATTRIAAALQRWTTPTIYAGPTTASGDTHDRRRTGDLPSTRDLGEPHSPKPGANIRSSTVAAGIIGSAAAQ